MFKMQDFRLSRSTFNRELEVSAPVYYGYFWLFTKSAIFDTFFSRSFFEQ